MAATTQGRLSEAQRLTIQRWVLKTLGYAFLIAFSIIFLIPFLWMVFTSVKTPWDAVSYAPSLFPDPTQLSMINFEYVGRIFPFYFGFRNTMLIVVGVEVGRLISASLVAYSLAGSDFVQDTDFPGGPVHDDAA